MAFKLGEKDRKKRLRANPGRPESSSSSNSHPPNAVPSPTDSSVSVQLGTPVLGACVDSSLFGLVTSAAQPLVSKEIPFTMPIKAVTLILAHLLLGAVMRGTILV